MKKLFIIATFVVLLAFTACGGNTNNTNTNTDTNSNSDTTQPATDVPVTITVPTNVIKAGIGGYNLKAGSDLSDFILREGFIDALWEPDGTLKIETTQANCDKQLTNITSFFKELSDELLDKDNSEYVYFLYNVDISDDFTSVSYIVNRDGYVNNLTPGMPFATPEFSRMKVNANFCMSIAQLYNNVSEYGFTVKIVDHDTGSVLASYNWPDRTGF